MYQLNTDNDYNALLTITLLFLTVHRSSNSSKTKRCNGNKNVDLRIKVMKDLPKGPYGDGIHNSEDLNDSSSDRIEGETVEF